MIRVISQPTVSRSRAYGATARWLSRSRAYGATARWVFRTRAYGATAHWLASLMTTIVLAASAAPLAAQGTAASPLPEMLKHHGIRAIEPVAAASDFRLQNLAGGETSLSDYYGSWVVLTFFATWCGPCRSELPSLEKVHQERGERGIVVLGVSVDDSLAPLAPFVRQLGLTFPILWDETKQVGAIYRASSIPTSYLVSPQGQLVGLSRGARDWAALTPMLDAALAAVPATASAEPDATAYADAGEGVATPSVADPPTAEVAALTATPVAGRPFTVDITLHWAGNFEEYLPQPPTILLPEGVVQQAMTAESSSRAGRHQLTYRATLLAEKPGRYALDPVELRYTTRFESTPVAARVAGPTVEVVAPTVLGFGPRTLAAGAGGLAVLGLAGWLASRRLRRREAKGEPRGKLFESLHGELEEARKKRLAGDGAGCLLALADLDAALRRALSEPEDDEVARRALREAVERARYGGEAPPGHELDKLQRASLRRLEALRPDPEKHRRKGLKLKDAS